MSAAVHRGEASAAIRFRYDPRLVDHLKADIPGYARRWDPARKQWTVDEPYVDGAIKLLRNYFDDVAILDTRRAATPAKSATPDWAGALYGALPDELRQPVFRALLRVLHPDAGGDTELAKQLNNAFRPQ